MKRSCGASSSSCSSSSPSPSPSCSSTSSSLEFQNPDQTEGRGRASNKRARRSNGNANGNGDGNNDDNKSKKVKPESSSSSAINGGRRSSVYRGVTRHRWTGRFEAHLWDKSCWNNLQNKKGRQVYLGAYDNEEAAARTYDLAALKYWGRDSILNFSIEIYTKELEEMEKVTKEEYLTSLRRQSSGFSRGVSKYRGVARHHHNGRWEARIGRVLGNKYLYLGTYGTQEEAATAYDLAAIHYRGANAVTNFDTSRYIDKINLINQNNNVESQEDQTVITIPSHVEEEVQDKDVEEAPPNSSSELDAESENLQNQKQPPQQQLQNREIELENPQIQTNQVSPPNEESSPIAPVDPTTTTTTDEQELPWIFMDDDGFSHFQVPDMPDGDLLSVFGDGVRRFDDDDIGFLFRPDPEEADFNLDAILSSPSCYGDLATADSTRMVTGDDDCGGQEKLLCSANSASCSPNSLISYSDYTS